MKRKVIFVCIVIALALCGCGGKNGENADSSDEKNQTSGEEIQKDVEGKDENMVSTEVTVDNLSSFPETDASCFSTEPVEGGVSITYCSYEGIVVVIPETIDGKKVVGISDYAFSQMEMQGIVIPDTVESIGWGAFEMCYDLKYINLGEGLKTVDAMAFDNCTSLVCIEFPEGMTTFYGVLFCSCDSLTEVVIPSSVTEFSQGIISTETCPDAVIVTPAGSSVEAFCIEYDIPYRN